MEFRENALVIRGVFPHHRTMRPAFLFDFDGVVVDSERYWPEIARGLLRTLARVPVEDGTEQRFMGMSMHGTYDIFSKELGMTLTLAEYEAVVLERAAAVYETSVQPLPGVAACLDRLVAAGKLLAIGSSNKRRLVDAGLEKHGLGHYFPVRCCGDDVPGRGKPHPDVFLLAAERLGVAPAACAVIEDSAAGVAAAKAAGMHCIALHTDHNHAQDLSAADEHIAHFDELDGAALLA